MHARIILIFPILLMPLFVFASPITIPEDQHAVEVIEDVAMPQEFFGTLNGFPHTYSFETEEEVSFTAHVYEHTSDAVEDTTLLLVKEEKRGVTEIGRTQGNNDGWSEVHDAVFAESFKKGGVIETTLAPGRYRLEVSSPNNDSRYRLVLAETDVSYGYWSALSTLVAVKSHFGSSLMTVFISPLVYVPLLVTLVFGGLYVWYVRKNRII